MKKIILLCLCVLSFAFSTNLLLAGGIGFSNFEGDTFSTERVTSSDYGDDLSDWGDKIKVAILTLGILLLVIFFKNIKNLIFKSSDIIIEGLVISKYSLNKENNDILVIEGRKSGIWSFIMTFLKIENKTIFSINQDTKILNIDNNNLNGNTKAGVLIKDVSSTIVGYNKNFVMLIFLGLILFIILFKSPMIAIIGGLILGIYYHISKSIFIEFETSGGKKIYLTFSTSLIENISMDIKKAKEVQDIIFELKTK